MAGAMTPVGIRYSPSLDGIRALAALVIVFYHARPPSFSGGFFGVDVFFVLSGYLITRLLVVEYETQGRLHYGAFIVRRLRRLLPAFLVFLAVYVLVTPLFFVDVPWVKHLRDAAWSAVYLVNYAAGFGEALAVLGHVWSLAVEMQFYLIWPLVIWGLLRCPRWLAIGVIGGLCLVATGWRWWAASNFEGVWDFYVRTDTHCSGLLLGGMLGYWNRRIHAHWAWIGFLILAFAMTFYSTHWLATARYGFSLAEIGAALLLLSQPAWLGNRLLVWLGTMSYGLYLWHYLFMRIMREWGWSWQETLVLGGSLGLLAATLSYYLVERHFYTRRATPA